MSNLGKIITMGTIALGTLVGASTSIDRPDVNRELHGIQHRYSYDNLNFRAKLGLTLMGFGALAYIAEVYISAKAAKKEVKSIP